jgi:predicted O-methyltransferase YrrM
MKPSTRRSSRAREIVTLALRDPRLCVDYLRAYRAGRRRSDRPPPSPPAGAVEPAAGRRTIAEWAGAPVDDGAALRAVRDHLAGAARESESESEVDRVAAGLAGDPSLGEIAYAVVRAARAGVVVETGVATGVTSAYVLAALADNETGWLESVDLPPLALYVAGRVGQAVPDGLRDRWSYHRGSSRRLLPRVLARHAGQVGAFIHDADHSYDAMRWELEQAWPALRPGGWLVADDVHLHSAFADVVSTTGARALYVRQPGKRGCTGVAIKR